jgi:hypothetical protein
VLLKWCIDQEMPDKDIPKWDTIRSKVKIWLKAYRRA